MHTLPFRLLVLAGALAVNASFLGGLALDVAQTSLAGRAPQAISLARADRSGTLLAQPTRGGGACQPVDGVRAGIRPGARS